MGWPPLKHGNTRADEYRLRGRLDERFSSKIAPDDGNLDWIGEEKFSRQTETTAERRSLSGIKAARCAETRLPATAAGSVAGQSQTGEGQESVGRGLGDHVDHQATLREVGGLTATQVEGIFEA